MRILQINNYAYLKGGSEKVFIDTISLLKKNGHDVKAFSAVDGTETEMIGDSFIKITPWTHRKGALDKIRGVWEFIYNRKVSKDLEKIILFKFRKFNLLILDCKIERYEPSLQTD